MARQLWDGDSGFIDRLSLDASGRFALAVADREAPGAAMRLFDTRTLRAAGPRISLSDWPSGHGCLAETPDGPVAVDIAPDRVRLWDPHRGTLLAETATRLPFSTVMAAATLAADGRTVLVAYGETMDGMAEWQAVDLRTGRRLPWRGDAHLVGSLHGARIQTAGDLLAVTAQEWRLKDDYDDPAFSHEEATCVAWVHRLPGGERRCSVELASGDAFATAAVAGRRFLAATSHPPAVYALPSLTVTAELPGARGQITVGTLNGRLAAVAETGSRDRLGLWHLDRPGEPATSVTVPPLRDSRVAVTDLTLSANDSLLIGTDTRGLWAVPGEELG